MNLIIYNFKWITLKLIYNFRVFFCCIQLENHFTFHVCIINLLLSYLLINLYLIYFALNLLLIIFIMIYYFLNLLFLRHILLK